MTRTVRIATAITLLLGMAGCVTVGYNAPTNGPLATVIVKASDQTINNPVMLHSDVCSDDDATLVGMLNSRAIGMANTARLEFQVRAGEKLSLSMMAGEIDFSPKGLYTEISIGGCRRIVDFVPEENATYEIMFIHQGDRCSYPVYKISTPEASKELASATVREGCTLPSHWTP